MATPETGRDALLAEAVLFIASSNQDSNLYHATRFLAGDPFIYLEVGGVKTIILSDLELGRGRKEARVDRVLSSAPYEARLRAAGVVPRLTDILDLHLKEIGVQRLTVPASFALAHAERLREKGYRVAHRDDPFYPQRMVKSAEELEFIAAAQSVAEEAMALAVDMISRSPIEGAVLRFEDQPLTAEKVRLALRRMLLDKGYIASEIIIAGGEQACDPHLRGTGPLPAHQPIVIDIFPRSLETRYWGDMTRTVVRGRASPEVKKLFRDVAAAKRLAISLLGEGAEGMDIHQAVFDLLKSRGNETGEIDGKTQGFIHGTGHGVGLDIHEPPRLSKVKTTLKAGNVVTVEPGLYYPGVGAVRLEDLLVVEDRGARNLNRFPEQLEV
jgi:Xaa-Pro aminopeptidase